MSRRTYQFVLAFVLLIATALVARTQAQGVAWEARFGSPADAYDEMRASAHNAGGETALAGLTWAGDDKDYDVLTVRLDASGKVLWSRTFNGVGSYFDAANDVEIDSEGNTYVGGITWQGYDAEVGTEYDYIVLKYSPTGELLWSRTYDGTAELYDEVYAMALDPQGSLIVTGMSWGVTIVEDQWTGHGDYTTIKFNTSGDAEWIRRYSGPDDVGGIARDVKTDSQGNVFVTGSAGVLKNQFDDQDIATLKYSPAGDLLWQSFFDGAGPIDPYDSASRLELAPDGSVYVIGENWPGGGEDEESDTRYDVLVLKIATNGALQWSRNWGSQFDDSAADLAVDSAGNLVVSGIFWREDDLHFWETGDAFLLKYDPSGSLLWEKAYNGPLDEDERLPLIRLDTADSIYMAVNTAGANGWDLALTKFLSDGSLVSERLYDGPGNDTDYLHSFHLDPSGGMFVGMSSWFGESFDFLAVKFVPGNSESAPPVASVTVDPQSTLGGEWVTGTVTLTAPAPSGGAFVLLNSSNPDVAFVPAKISVASGQTSGTFDIYTSPVGVETAVEISGQTTGDAKSATLTVNPAALVELGSFEPYIVGGTYGSAYVQLNGPAPYPDGANVYLTSSNPAVAWVDEFVNVPGGDLNANASFAINTTGVKEPTRVEISATYNGVTLKREFTIVPASLQYLFFDPSYGPGGRKITGMIGLDGVAPEGGMTVSLVSENSAILSVPETVFVPEGESFITFTARTYAVNDYTGVAVTATDGVSMVTGDVFLRAPLLSSFRVDPEAVAGGGTVTGRAILDGIAPAGGIVLTLTSSHPDVIIPPTELLVPEGANVATVEIPTTAVTEGVRTTITAQDTLFVRRFATVAVVPPGAMPDTVAIQTARLFTSWNGRTRMTVEATSTSEFASLKVYDTASGRHIATLNHLGGGKFAYTFGLSFKPTNITVVSSFGGSATKDVTQ